MVEALTTLGKLFKDKQPMAGGQKGALEHGLPRLRREGLRAQARGGHGLRGDFVAGVAKDQFGKKIGQDANFFPFPAVDGGKAPVVSGGDAAVVLKDGKNQKAAMTFLGRPAATP